MIMIVALMAVVVVMPVSVTMIMAVIVVMIMTVTITVIVAIMRTSALEILIDDIIHFAGRAFARFVGTTALAVHRTDVPGGIFRPGFIDRFFDLGVVIG